MVAAAGGVGWVGSLAWVAHPAAGNALQRFFPDWFNAPFTWTGELSLSSHFFAAHLLLLVTFWMLLKKPSAATATGAFIAAAALGLLHPYSLGLVVGVALAAPLLGTLARREICYGDYVIPAAAVLGAAIASWYYWQSLEHDAGLASWYSQNILPSPNPLGLLLAYLPLLPLVAVGVRKLWQQREQAASRLVLAWLALPALLAYLPLLYQRRFLDGYFIPVGLVAAIGWAAWKPRQPAKAAAAAVLVALLAVTPLLRAALQVDRLAHWLQQDVALTQDEAAALLWVGEHCQPGEAALADRAFVRLWVPFLASNCRTDAAHHHLSFNYQQRSAAAAELFSSSTPQSAAALTWDQFFKTTAQYVVVSDPAWPALPSLALAASFGSVRVFTAAD
jgi:hypothetical protein